VAQVVLIAAGTARPGICAVGDVVAIHDDDVELSGAGYTHLKVVRVQGVTAADLRVMFAAIEPSRKEENETYYWLDGATWKEIKAPPKYAISSAGWTEQDETDLASTLTSAAAREAILAKVEEKIHLDPNNQTLSS